MAWVLGMGCGATALLSVATMGVAGLAASVVGLGAGPPLAGGIGSGAAPAADDIPPVMLALYRQAAASCPGLSYAVLAAIGTVESSNGTSTAPGVQSGANGAGAEGPMQFLPATFAEYAMPVPPGGARPPSPYDPTDAVYAAARLLCAAGAGSADASGLARAVFAYNHSAAYVDEVLALASAYVTALGP